MYSWVRKFNVAGITSPEILLSFSTEVAEATVALCAKNIVEMISSADSDSESSGR